MATPIFQNIYYKRTAATAKPCYMCFRPTPTVLATINTVDFFYTCDGHLKDNGFASSIVPPPSTAAQKVSDEEIRKVKEEWEEKQRRKDTESTEGKPVTPKSPPPPPAPIPVPVPEQTTAAKPHDKYALHRDVWAMRLAEHRKRRQTAAAKEVAPRLPSAPQRRL